MTSIRRFIAGALALGWMFAAPAVVLLPSGPAGATVNTSANKTIVAGNGAQTVFTFNFIGVAAQYISVVYTDAFGNQTTLTQGSGATQYQLSLNPPVQGAVWGVGGTVTYNPNGTPIAAGTTLTIMRTLPLTQAVSLANQQSVQALGNGAETAVDTAVMQGQQISEQIGRALQMNASNASSPNPLPPAAQAAGQGLCFDGSGNNVIACSLAPSGVISSAMAPVVDAASLAAGRTALGLGTMAQENINAGTCGGATIQDDGSGNARANLFSTVADSVSQTVTCAFHGTQRIATGPITYTLPRASTLFNGFTFRITALAGIETLTPNAADSFAGGVPSGTSATIPSGSTCAITTDAKTSGTWYIDCNAAGGVVSPLTYGARCDGGTDDTAAVARAISALGSTGGTVQFPNANCAFAGTIAIGTSGIHLKGAGINGTTLTFTGAGAADAITIGTFPASANCTGASPPSSCLQITGVSVEDMTITAPNRTGGYLFDINGAREVLIQKIFYPSSWLLAATAYVNNVEFHQLNGYIRSTSGSSYGILLYNAITTGTNSGWYRSDQIGFDHVFMNAQAAGANCFGWDGMVNTVVMTHVALLSCANGLVVNNSQASTMWFPLFLMADDLEVDGSSLNSVLINAGRDFHIVNGELNNSGNGSSLANYPLAVNFDANSNTCCVFIDNTAIHDTWGGAAKIDVQDVTISNSHFFDTNHAGNGMAPTIDITAHASNVLVTGSFLGQRYGDSNKPSYGIQVEAGAGVVSAAHNSYSGTTVNNVNNLSANIMGFLGGITRTNGINTATTCAAATAC
jgi:hypothetical protein